MMDLINKAVSLGLGFAVTSKEQVEKLVDELVKKGEVSRADSSAYVQELVAKGSDARQKIEDIVRERVQKVSSGLPLASMADIERLERRIDELERRLEAAGDGTASTAGSSAESHSEPPSVDWVESPADREAPPANISDAQQISD